MRLAITILAVLVLGGVASADKKDRADALFKQGKKLMTEQRYADACEAFEESYKLDPGIGGQLNIARCYEEWGKLGRAFTLYQAAEKAARNARDPRADKIKELIDSLDPQVPRLTVNVPKNAPKNFKVTMDRKPVTVIGQAFVVDPGPKTLEWWVGDGPKKQKIVAIERGGESEVMLDIPKGRVAKKSGDGQTNDDKKKDDDQNADDPPDSRPPAPGRTQRIGGIALAGAGVLAIGVSSVMTLSARGKYNDALEMYCNNMKNACDPMGLQLTQDARSTANTATVIFLVGAAAVGGGVALYLLAPSGPTGMDEEAEEQASRYLVPSVTDRGAGIVFGGRF